MVKNFSRAVVPQVQDLMPRSLVAREDPDTAGRHQSDCVWIVHSVTHSNKETPNARTPFFVTTLSAIDFAFEAALNGTPVDRTSELQVSADLHVAIRSHSSKRIGRTQYSSRLSSIRQSPQ